MSVPDNEETLKGRPVIATGGSLGGCDCKARGCTNGLSQ